MVLNSWVSIYILRNLCVTMTMMMKWERFNLLKTDKVKADVANGVPINFFHENYAFHFFQQQQK